ncbi:LysR family transcriptional regulator [Pseudomonas jinjuensis]|uniref:DNA-binding transcriptional regulator, LysR family n=1 Tax=Pseudomonas jinjuensis TaxID=198616 RepID=A0A1H0EAP3_9PSED|nr:LysR family transcriptional regulator [Pseudomonas jinjuensis]SDN79411.1 DNA-binding transcriptional regulator, LysR family [Pseudomonas jinjuensis]
MHDLRQLRHFIALAEHCNFARAAEAVNLSQPALTRSLQALERALDCQLLDRSARSGVNLTEHGRLVLEHARRLLAADQALKRAVSRLSNLEGGELHIGAGTFPSVGLVPRALGRFLEAHPRVQLSLISDNRLRLRDYLLNNRIELYVADVREVFDDPQLAIEPLHNYPILVFCRPRHPLLQGSDLGPEQLGRFPLATTPLPTRETIHVGRLNDRYPPLSFQCDNFTTLRGVVGSSDTLGMAPWDLLAEDVEAGRLAVVPLPKERLDLATDYAIVSRRGQSPSPAGAALKAMLLEEDERMFGRFGR